MRSGCVVFGENGGFRCFLILGWRMDIGRMGVWLGTRLGWEEESRRGCSSEEGGRVDEVWLCLVFGFYSAVLVGKCF